MAVFFDTNVIVYAHDRRDSAKHAVADALLRQHVVAGTVVISSQVVQEFCHVAMGKGRTSLRDTDMQDVLARILFPIMRHVPSQPFYIRALELFQRYQLSWYDALIVQAALDLSCDTLYSEDLQAGQQFGELTVVNPFEAALEKK